MTRVSELPKDYWSIDVVQHRLNIGLFLLLIVAVVPFVILVHYAQPSADDFCYADAFRDADIWRSIKGEYLGWKGRYATIVLTVAFHHFGGMLITYQYAMFLFLASLCAAIYIFVWSLTEGNASRWRTLFLSLGLAALYLGTMHRVPATLYWLDGALQYQLGGIFVLLSLSALLGLYRTGRPSFALAACPCIFVAIGATEIAMMTLVAVVVVMAFNRISIHGRDRPSWAAVSLVTLASSALLVLAPGNYVRAEYASADAHRFWFSVSHAFYYGGGTLGEWLANPALWLATAAFAPAAMRLAYLGRVRRQASVPRLALIVLLITGLEWSFFFGLWWTVADNPPARMLNLLYLLFLAGWFTAVLELVAIIARRRRLPFVEQVFPTPARIGAMLAATAFAVFLLVKGHAATAYIDLVYRVPDYDRVMHQRYATIAKAKAASGNERPALILPRVADPPRVLMHSDIQEDRKDWRNGCFARYFGLKSVARR